MTNSAQQGYWFETEEENPPLLRKGSHVQYPAGKKGCIVLYQQIHSILLTSWPGKLWRARVVTLGDMSGLIANPGYWRAQEIELLEELPLASLFGEHGQGVVQLLNQAQQLTLAQAIALGMEADEEAQAAYARAWRRWALATNYYPSIVESKTWHGTLAAASERGKSDSPVHSGFVLLYSLIKKKARALQGDEAFIVEVDPDDGETETYFTPLWYNASDAFLHAAMALSAPQYIEDEDFPVLTRAWRNNSQ